MEKMFEDLKGLENEESEGSNELGDLTDYLLNLS